MKKSIANLISIIRIIVGIFLFFYKKDGILLKIIAICQVIAVQLLKKKKKIKLSPREETLEKGKILLESIKNKIIILTELERANDEECTLLLNDIKECHKKRKKLLEK